MERRILPLSSERSKLYIIDDKVKENAQELEQFLDGNDYMNSKQFSKNVLFSQEIKANNTIEGYNDDIELVYDILNKKLKIEDKDRMQRIRNLYNGYKYIFKDKEINKDNLKELYGLLSKKLLTKEDLSNMGKYYRNAPVYIFYSSATHIKPDEGIPHEKVETYMDELIDYINRDTNDNTLTSHFIKSQIMHFQFVNIHPYFDINGRTARTTAMWYLLNNKAYPYIIFNRGISLNKNTYYKIIRDVKKFSNATFFVNYMLENVKIELEKEYVIDMIKSVNNNLTALDYQTLYYILSMNGLITVNDFITFYNAHNDKKRPIEIYETMIEPLLDRGILVKEKETNRSFSSKNKNFIFSLNDTMYENDPSKIKKLSLK